MSGVRVTVETDTAIRDQQRETAQKSPTLMQTGVNLEYRRFRAVWLPELRFTPRQRAPGEKVNWTSERQRKAYFATDGFGGGIPYQRHTPGLSDLWTITHDTFGDGGAVTVENPSPIARYVIGEDQQVFHADTGWQRYEPILDQMNADWQRRQDAIWATVSDPT